MKKTGRLSVRPLRNFGADRLAVHPNDGFDLGMMTREYAVSLCADTTLDKFLGGDGGQGRPARVELLNECPHRALEMDHKLWESLGMPDSAVILYDGARIFLHRLSGK